MKRYHKNVYIPEADKNIITIYANTADDDHVTLNKNLYVKN